MHKNNSLLCRYKKTANLFIFLLGLLILGITGYYFYQFYQTHQALPQKSNYWVALLFGLFVIFFTKSKRAKWVKIDLHQKKVHYYKNNNKLSTEDFTEMKNIRIITFRQNLFAVTSGVELVSPKGKKLVGLFGKKEKAQKCAQLYQKLLGISLRDDEWILLG